MAGIARTYVKLLAPILAQTAEEVWDHLPAPREAESIHLALFPETAPAGEEETALLTRWEKLLTVRSDVAREIEKLRVSKKIGNSLEASVELATENPELWELLSRHQADLPMILIVSGIKLEGSPSDGFVKGTDVPALAVRVSRSGHTTCARCWTYRESVGVNRDHPGLCARCAEVVVRATTSSQTGGT
jgi:isoleucyl-tRNA synthetase